MTVQALSSTSVALPISGAWVLLVEVRDADDVLVDAAPVITITPPSGAPVMPAVETVTTGVYRLVHVVTATGRYVARVVSASYGAADFTAFVTAVTLAAGMPDLTDVRDYLREDADSWTDAEVQDALDAETAAQRGVCRIPADYGADLAQALKRRVQCNLARRGLPLAVLQGDAEAGTPGAVPPTNDPEVRRFERPYRKLVIG
jgi:hypothetical protein